MGNLCLIVNDRGKCAMNKQRVLIFFGAHPDDETFGIGSTLANKEQYSVPLTIDSPATMGELTESLTPIGYAAGK